MLRIKAEARRSAIHGLGLFALEPIARGTVVSGWDPQHDYKLSREVWRSLPMGLIALLEPYVWVGGDGAVYGTSDDGRFTNHSGTPNLGEWNGLVMRALRDIAVDEELTEDYGSFDHAFSDYAAALRP